MLETFFYLLLFILFLLGWTIVLLIAASAIALLIFKVPFAPTPSSTVQTIINLFGLKPGQIFYDLGCGDGRFLMAASQKGAKATGFEIAPWAFLRGKINLWQTKSQAKILFKNFYEVNLADADAIYCFLMAKVMPQVEAKLEKELKTGTKVITYGFPLPTWKQKKVIDLDLTDKKSSCIYVYRKK